MAANRLNFACFSFLATLALTIGPVFFIRRDFNDLFLHWQEVVFYLLCIAASLLSAALGFSLIKGIKESIGQRRMLIMAAAFWFLYLSAIVLCERISFGSFDNEIYRTIGMVIFILGLTVRLKAIASLGSLHSAYVTIQSKHKLVTGGPYKLVRHPSYAGALLALAGLPMIFGTWFPLLAMPGAFVALKWRMNDEEKLLFEHFGKQYDDYRKGTHRLIPYIY